MYLKAWYWKACLLALTAAILGFIMRGYLGWPEDSELHRLEHESPTVILWDTEAIEIRDAQTGRVVRIEDTKIIEKLQRAFATVKFGERALQRHRGGQITFYLSCDERAVGSFAAEPHKGVFYIAGWPIDDPEIGELLSKELGIKGYIPIPGSSRPEQIVVSIQFRDLEIGGCDVVRIEDGESINKLLDDSAGAKQVAPMPFEGKIVLCLPREEKLEEVEGSFGYDPEKKIFHIGYRVFDDPEMWELVSRALDIKEDQPAPPPRRTDRVHAPGPRSTS